MSMSPSNPASLLISLHDVSPLTLSECEQAVALLAELGIGASALTVLAIPHHEGALRSMPTRRRLSFCAASRRTEPGWSCMDSPTG